MEIGSNFEDDYFEQPATNSSRDDLLKLKSEQHKNAVENYVPKFLSPHWFMEKKSDDPDPEENLKVLKYQADFHYFSSRYAEAVSCYEQCLGIVPPNNTTWQREFMENIAWCHLQLDQAEVALQWSLKLDECSTTSSQKIVSMNLLASVCHKLKKFKEELEALHGCMEVHKSAPDFWQRLAFCYAGLFGFCLPEETTEKASATLIPCPKDTLSEVTPEEESLEPCCDFKSHIQETKMVLPNKPKLVQPNCSNSSATASGSSDLKEKCDTCTLGSQIISMCLIQAKELIDSVPLNSFNTEKFTQIKDMIQRSLHHMEVDEKFIEMASKSLGLDFLAGLKTTENPLEDNEPT